MLEVPNRKFSQLGLLMLFLFISSIAKSQPKKYYFRFSVDNDILKFADTVINPAFMEIQFTYYLVDSTATAKKYMLKGKAYLNNGTLLDSVTLQRRGNTGEEFNEGALPEKIVIKLTRDMIYSNKLDIRRGKYVITPFQDIHPWGNTPCVRYFFDDQRGNEILMTEYSSNPDFVAMIRAFVMNPAPPF